MSLKSDTTDLDEQKPEREWWNPKPHPSRPKLKPMPSWMIPKSEGPIPPISEESRQKVLRECYKGVEEYINRSPYDAIAPPFPPKLFGGNPVVPLDITDQNRPLLQELSQLALEEYYNNNKQEGSSASFEFHDLVKCTIWNDYCYNPFVTSPRPLRPTEYYITFQAKAKAKGDTSSSSSPDITIFQAKVLVDRDDIDNKQPPVVGECRIQI